MTVVLTRRADINLETVFRVAWQGEDVRIAPAALQRIAECRRSFMALLDNDPDLIIYGVTTGAGDRASVRLSPEQRKAQADVPRAPPPRLAVRCPSGLPVLWS